MVAIQQLTVQIPAINIGFSKAIWCLYKQYKVFSEAIKKKHKNYIQEWNTLPEDVTNCALL